MSLLMVFLLVVAAATALALWVAYQRKSKAPKAAPKAPKATERFRSHHDEEDDEDDEDEKEKEKDKEGDEEERRHKHKHSHKHGHSHAKRKSDDDDDDDEEDTDSDSDSDSEGEDDGFDRIGQFAATDDTEADDLNCGNSSARRRVVDAFIAVVGRSPTPREICVYVQPDLATASTADLRRAIQKDYAPAKKSKPVSSAAAATTTATATADPEPYSTTTALAVSSVRQEPDRSGSYKKSKSLLVQRADMLKRLDNILSEVEQFRQFIQMM